MDPINKSMIIQGWFSNAHISCKLYGLGFKSARNRTLNLTLSHLVFHNNGVILRNVSCSNTVVSSCRFVNCRKAVVIEQEPSNFCRKSSLVITDTEFLYNGISVFAHLFNNSLTVNISRCIFQGKVGRFKIIDDDRNMTGAVYIKSKTLKNRVYVFGYITDSIFRELGHDNNDFALSVRVYDYYSTGYLRLLNTTFLNNENAVLVYGGFDVQMIQVMINSTYGYAVLSGAPPKVRPSVVGVKVFLNQCTLRNNRVGIRMAVLTCLGLLCLTSSQELVVKNSLFLGGNETRGTGDAIRFRVSNDANFPRPDFIEARMLLENVTFQGLYNCALYVGMQKNVKGLISVRNCKFRNNSQFVSQLDERATVQIEFKDENPPKCRKQKWKKVKKFAQSKTSQIPVIFENSIFENNVGISAALNFLNGNVTFRNCTFKDNEGLTLGGHVYMKPGYGRLNIVNGTFLQTRLNDGLSNARQSRILGNGCFLHSESTGPVDITNSSFEANVNRRFSPIIVATETSAMIIDATSTFQCPSGKQVKLEKMEKTEGFEFTKGGNTCWIKVTHVDMFCEECPDEFYSLQRGLATGLDINKRKMCLKCPYGASCKNGKVKAKENFWGLHISTNQPSLKFFPCPLKYCSSPNDSEHYTYNSCYGNRSGLLCGKCSDGYSEALYSTSCRKKEKCNDHWFWLATIIYVVVFAVYFVFKPPVFSVLYRQTLWFKKTAPSPDVQSMTHEDEKEHDPGYLKIVFYFYQVVELVMIKSPEKAFHMVPFIPPVIAIFNFQVKTLEGSIGCPFPGLNVVTKQLFLCSKFLATLFFIGIIYAIHQAASKSRYIFSPSLTSYLAVALEILLLGYETLTDTALKLMHCVPVGMDWRLFADGNIQCWQWWQYLIITFIVVFIIPLILVLLWGSLMLAKDKVSAKEFLVASAFPLPCLLRWIIQHCKKKEGNGRLFTSNHHDAEEVKKILHDPFREPSNGEHGTLYWESVLTGRRLVLLSIHNFAADPQTRFVLLNCASVAILVHHLTLRPFRDRKANIFETLSLMSLVAICSFSWAESTYFSEGIDPTGPSQSLFHALQWIEIGLLSMVPAAVCIILLFAVLSQVFRLLYHCIRLLSRCECFMRNLSLGHLSMSRQLLLNSDVEDLPSVA